MKDLLSTDIARQIGRFGIVGIVATLTHIIVAFVLHYGLAVTPLTANFFAFCIAWIVSYRGHFYWTFADNNGHLDSLPKFAIVSLAGLALNQLIVWVFSELFELSFMIAIFFVTVVIPVLTFVASKFWAFRNSR